MESNRFIYIFSSSVILTGLLTLWSIPVYAAATVDFSLPEKVEAESEFGIDFSVAGASADTTYYAKVAAYHESDPSYLYYAYSKGKDEAWLAYNDGWAKFSEFSSNSEGTVSGRLTAKIRSDKEFGTIGVKIRLAKKDKTSSQINSGAKNMTVTAPPPPPEPEPEPEPESETATDPEPEPEPTNETTPEQTSTDQTNDSPIALIAPTPHIAPTKSIKPEYRLPATFSAVLATLGQSSASSEASLSASPSATPSATFLTDPKFAIIAGSALLTTLVAGGVMGYRHFHRQ